MGPPRMSTAYVGLGSNLGDRAVQIEQALQQLARTGVRVRRVSAVYESDPVGPVRRQPRFFNAAAELQTAMEPQSLLAWCLQVEQRLGRRRGLAKGPRTIDIDLLLFDEQVGRWPAGPRPALQLPHPALAERAFVLRPLLELRPELYDPRSGHPLMRRLVRLQDQWLRRAGDLSALAAAERAASAARSAVPVC